MLRGNDRVEAPVLTKSWVVDSVKTVGVAKLYQLVTIFNQPLGQGLLPISIQTCVDIGV